MEVMLASCVLVLIGVVALLVWREQGRAVRQMAERLVKEKATPLIEGSWLKMEEVRNRLQQLKGMAQCPWCGEMVTAGTMCEGLSFICPHCSMRSQWKTDAEFMAENDRYVLEKAPMLADETG